MMLFPISDRPSPPAAEINDTAGAAIDVEIEVGFHGQVSINPPIVSVDDFVPPRVVAEANKDGSISLCRSGVSEWAESAQKLAQKYSTSPAHFQPVRPCLGVAAAVAYYLSARGYRLRVRHRRVGDPGEVAEAERGADTRVARFVSDHKQGLIRYRHRHLHHVLADLAQQLPQATIVIATASNRTAKRIRSHLRQAGVPADLVTVNREPARSPGRIVIGTFQAMGHTAIECNKRSVFLIPRATDALHRSNEHCLCQADFRCRLFGLQSVDAGLAESEQLRLQLVFGFAQLELDRRGQCQSRPMVEHFKYRGGHHKAGADSAGVALALAANGERNRLIAKLAKQLATDAGPADQVIVLVHLARHADRLRKLLGWPWFADAAAENIAAFPGVQRSLWPTVPGRAVATALGAEMLWLPTEPGCTTVIWAGAGGYLPPLPEHWLIQPIGAQRQLHIVDVTDRNHPILRRDVKARKAAYQAAEWLPPGSDVIAHRIKGFLSACARCNSA